MTPSRQNLESPYEDRPSRGIFFGAMNLAMNL